MTAPSEDIKDIMIDSSVGLDWIFGISLFISEMPDSPDICAAIYDTGGFPPNPMIEGNFFPTIQIRIRGKVGTYNATYAKVKEVRDALHRLTNITIGSVRYIHLLAQGDILFVGKDDRNRPIFSINFKMDQSV